MFGENKPLSQRDISEEPGTQDAFSFFAENQTVADRDSQTNSQNLQVAELEALADRWRSLSANVRTTILELAEVGQAKTAEAAALAGLFGSKDSMAHIEMRCISISSNI